MNKREIERRNIHQKYKGRCAYCGENVPYEKMQVDHLKPIYRGNKSVHPKIRGDDTIDNKMPSCAVCNRWKATMTIDQFRSEIESQINRLRRDSASFRMAEKYNLVEVQESSEVRFWFEHWIR